MNNRGTNKVNCENKVMNGRRVAGEIKVLVKNKELILEIRE